MIDDRMIRNWRTKYGLSLGTPAEAARWWETHNDGRAPPGAVEALGLCIEEIERLRQHIDDNAAQSIHTCHDQCQRIECVQRREIERLRDLQRRAIDLLTLGYDPPCEEYHPECPGCQAHDLIGGAQS